MADWYIDGENGDAVLGDGSSGNPWRSIAQGFGSWASGDTFYMAGVCRGQNGLSINNATFTQWPGATACKVRGATLLDSGSWTDDTLGAYWSTVAGSNNIHSVIVNPDDPAVLDANGNAKVHLTAASSLANCRATDNSWFHDTAANRLYVRIDANEDPSQFAVEWCAGVLSGFILTGNGNRVQNIEIQYFCDTDSGTPGYALFITGNGNVVSNVVTRDCGYHSIGVVGNGAKTNNLFENVTCRGLYPLAGTAVGHFVFYATANGSANNRARNCTLHCHAALHRDGTALLTSTAPIQGCYSHTDGGSNVINDVVWENVVCYYRYGNPGTPFQAANTTAPTDPVNWRTYNVRCVRCFAYGAKGFAYGADEAISYYRCSFRVTVDVTSGTGLAYAAASDDTAKYLNWTACELITDMDFTGLSAVFRGRGTGTRFALVGTSVILNGTGTNQRAVFFPWNSSVITDAYGCIFEHNQTNAGLREFYIGDDYDQTGTPRRFSNNVYVNVTANRYSTRADYNTFAEWLASIDTGAIETSTSQFANVTANNADTGDASLTAAAKNTRKGTSPHSDIGFNGLPYIGNYGAWQYGSVSRVRTRHGLLSGGDAGSSEVSRHLPGLPRLPSLG